LYTTQHRAILIIFPLILQTSTKAQMLSIGGEGCDWQAAGSTPGSTSNPSRSAFT